MLDRETSIKKLVIQTKLIDNKAFLAMSIFAGWGIPWVIIVDSRATTGSPLESASLTSLSKKIDSMILERAKDMNVIYIFYEFKKNM